MEGETKSRKRVSAVPAALLVLVGIIICYLVWLSLIQAEYVSAIELQDPVESVEAVCNKTLYPELCYSSLSPNLGSSPSQPKKLLHLALMVAMDEANKAFALVLRFVKKASAFQDCIELMDVTREQLDSSISLLKRHDLKTFTSEQASDMQTWLSASITNQDTCLEGISEYPKSIARALVRSSVENVRKLVSNSLAIAKSTYESKHGDPSPELRLPSDSNKDSFPSWLSAGDRRLLRVSPNDVAADVIVAQDGSGNFKTITEAIDAAPAKSSKRYVIKVRKGTYKENVQVSKQNIMLIGDGMEATIVTGSRNVVDNSTTFNSATFAAVGKGFMAQDMAFVNTAGPQKHQAVALRVGSDQSVLYRCKIAGYQDTLYAHSLRQFYRECKILGTVDFIFGNGAVVIQSCTLVPRKPGASQKNAITAQGRSDPNQNTGTSIHRCTIAADADLVPVKSSFPTYLGRPWMAYSRTVFMQSVLGDVIDPAGWLEWDGDFALKTLYYGEYMNTGPGSATGNRVKWPGYRVISSSEEASQFTVGEFIQGDSWLQSTGVAYVDGLTD
jgi:pectinesterase